MFFYGLWTKNLTIPACYLRICRWLTSCVYADVNLHVCLMQIKNSSCSACSRSWKTGFNRLGCKYGHLIKTCKSDCVLTDSVVHMVLAIGGDPGGDL